MFTENQVPNIASKTLTTTPTFFAHQKAIFLNVLGLSHPGKGGWPIFPHGFAHFWVAVARSSPVQALTPGVVVNGDMATPSGHNVGVLCFLQYFF